MTVKWGGTGQAALHATTSLSRHSILVERNFIITVPFRLLGALGEMTAQKQRSWRRAPYLPVRARSTSANSPGATLEGSGETHTSHRPQAPKVLWGGGMGGQRDPTPVAPHGTRHTRLGASCQRSYPPTLHPKAQPWGKKAETNSRRQGREWSVGDEEPAGRQEEGQGEGPSPLAPSRDTTGQ